MADEANKAPAAESKGAETVAPTDGQQNAVAENASEKKPEAATETADAKKEATLGDILPESKPKPAEEPKKSDAPPKGYVPEAAFLELKSELKDIKRDIRDGKITKGEVSTSLEELGAKYDVDPDFLQGLAASIKKDTEAEFNQRLEKELEPYKKSAEASKKGEIDKVFTEHYEKTLEAMPEFKGVANKEVIKALALDPRNADKTFGKILEEAYGHLVSGKRTLDDSKPGSGKTITEIDFEKAKRDTDYFQQIMASPELKKKYNEGLESRLRL